ncbi:protein of unknown function [Shewanella benthica]|uniref:Uncharacterized protein n=1 Tax=Shewanella benthica TaxID=43661 RepID=A0A330M8F3_9GAMM|nr:protein of unknown function [Shewanella benthica]
MEWYKSYVFRGAHLVVSLCTSKKQKVSHKKGAIGSFSLIYSLSIYELVR